MRGRPMPSNVSLTGSLEATVKNLVASGRYQSQNDVIREGILLVEEREKKRVSLGAALEIGINDADAGRVHLADDVFSELRARYTSLIENQK
jgi:antitoxin ParD1/3/4